MRTGSSSLNLFQVKYCGQTCSMKKSIVAVAQQAEVSLTWSASPKTGFLISMLLLQEYLSY